ncbi:unnamed protein product [Prorocentrum cordatum]|uniref:Uncharacterized protein n=1 Tax=Prorocentrum cordatum TaxID=2364126 RepID=A0ABN9WTY8_9DINO|nr:unnamed protein product [Polarella glacialis]
MNVLRAGAFLTAGAGAMQMAAQGQSQLELFGLENSSTAQMVEIKTPTCTVTGAALSQEVAAADGNLFVGYRGYQMTNTPTGLLGTTQIVFGSATSDVTVSGSCSITLVSGGSLPALDGLTDLTGADIGGTICPQSNQPHGSGHKCFSHCCHHAWCAPDGGVTWCDQTLGKVARKDIVADTITFTPGWWVTAYIGPIAGHAGGGAGGGSAGGAAAVGDPHLQNIHGERFDLMKEGRHVLISIPRGEGAEQALLRVQADARRLGGQCADMYFQELNVTGSWAEAKQAGGYHYSVLQSAVEAPQWIAFGKVELKVVHGRTGSGLRYLNVYVKHLAHAGFAVGGLLGEDDHEDVTIAGESCAKQMSL